MSDHSHDSSPSFSGHETSHANDSTFSQSQPDSFDHSSHSSHSHSSSGHSAHTSHSPDSSHASQHGHDAHNGRRSQDEQNAQDSANGHAQHGAHASHQHELEQAELLRNAGVATAFLHQRHNSGRFHGDGDLSPDLTDDSPQTHHARLLQRSRRVQQGTPRADSIGSVIFGLGAVAFGIFWTFYALSLTRAFHSSFISVILPLFGVAVTIIAMVRVMKSIINLTSGDGSSGDGSNRNARD